jgi:hypothetical protein
MDGHDRHHHHAGVGQDLGGLVRLAVHRAQGWGERKRPCHSRPRPIELQRALIVSKHGVATRTDASPRHQPGQLRTSTDRDPSHPDESSGLMSSSHLPQTEDGTVMPPTRPRGANPPIGYQIIVIVRGKLSRRYRTVFEGMTLVVGNGQTAIIGPVRDQTHLHGLLDRVGNLGLELVSVNATHLPPTSDSANRT